MTACSLKKKRKKKERKKERRKEGLGRSQLRAVIMMDVTACRPGHPWRVVLQRPALLPTPDNLHHSRRARDETRPT